MSRQVVQNFVNIQPDGSVLFDFDGHINARGLVLPALNFPTPPSDTDSLVYRRSGDASIAAFLYAISHGPAGIDTERGAIHAEARDNNSLGERLLVDSNDRSAFPEVVRQQGGGGSGPGQWQLRLGRGTINWAGITNISQQVQFNHALGVIPLFFAFFMLDQTGTGPCHAQGISRDAVNCFAQFVTNGFIPAGLTGTWGAVAIGDLSGTHT